MKDLFQTSTMERQLCTFPFSQRLIYELSSKGFTTTEDLKDLSFNKLTQDVGLSEDDASCILAAICPERSESVWNQGTDAYNKLVSEKSKKSIFTSCENIDSILRGGIPVGQITEVCGTPGSGKTQLCFQLCCNVCLPLACGGLDAEVVYIDTEGSFMVDRLVQIAKGSMKELSVDLKKILEGVHYFHCKDFVQLVSCINLLKDFILNQPKVALVIIDSISFHFRYGFEKNYRVRLRLLYELSQQLQKLANQHNIAVVMTNQMTTKIGPDSQILIPALGESWSNMSTVRLILSTNGKERRAQLTKSSRCREATAIYQVSVDGIRDP